jgi:hypothetical protein
MFIFKWFATLCLALFLSACVQVKENSPFLRQSVNTTLSYSTNSLTLEALVPITPLTPVSSNFVATSFSINPALSNGLIFDQTNGEISGTPNGSLAETTYIISATNSDKTISTTIKIRIIPFNNPSVTQNFIPSNLNEDSELLIQLNYTDQDGDLASTCSISNLTHVTVTTPCSCIIGICSVGITGEANYYGTASFSYTVSEGGKTSNSSTASLIINAVDDPPIGFIATESMNEDSSKNITLNYSDLEGDLATTCQLQDLVHLDAGSSCSCSAGICQATIIPTSNYFGTATFNYSVTTNSLTSTKKSITVNVASVDDAPTANLINDIADEDIEKIVTLTYADVEGDLATSCSLTQLTNLSITTPCSCLVGICQVGVTGLPNYYGPASFQYSIEAKGLISNFAVASIDISSINDSPIIQAASTNYSVTVGETLSDVSINISDVESTLECNSTFLTITSTNQLVLPDSNISIHGIAPNCLISLNPPLSEYPSTALELKIVADDQHGNSSEKKLNVTVNPEPITIFNCQNLNATYLRDNTLKPIIERNGTSVEYVISPALPDGLSFDNQNGIISGKPTTLESNLNFTITASNSISSIDCYLNLSNLEILPSSLQIDIAGGIIFSDYKGTIETQQGSPATNYHITSGSLPAGLSLDESTGKISGTIKSGFMDIVKTLSIESTNGAGSSIEEVKMKFKFPSHKLVTSHPLGLFNKNFTKSISALDSFLLVNQQNLEHVKVDTTTGTFSIPMTMIYPNNGEYFADAITFDFSGDGYDDLILTDTMNQNIVVFSAEAGDDKKFIPTTLPSNIFIDKNSKLFAWDINGDSNKDLIYASSVGTNIYFTVYINKSSNGILSFETPRSYKAMINTETLTSNILDKPFAITVYDFDNDSVDDLALVANDKLYFFNQLSFDPNPIEVYAYVHSQITLDNFPYDNNINIKPINYDSDSSLELEISSKGYVYWLKTKPKADNDLTRVKENMIINYLGNLEIIATDWRDFNDDGKEDYLIYAKLISGQQAIMLYNHDKDSHELFAFERILGLESSFNNVINSPGLMHFQGLQLFDSEEYEGTIILQHDTLDFLHIKPYQK